VGVNCDSCDPSNHWGSLDVVPQQKESGRPFNWYLHDQLRKSYHHKAILSLIIVQTTAILVIVYSWVGGNVAGHLKKVNDVFC